VSDQTVAFGITFDGLQAWDCLLETLFTVEDQVVIEWAIGSVIAGGPTKVLAVSGPAASGKTTVFHLARKIIEHCKEEDSLHVVFHDWDSRRLPKFEGRFVFFASLDENLAPDDSIRIKTTGVTHSNDTWRMLRDLIQEDPGTVGSHCLGTFRDLGPDYYDNQENNK
jgi:hypothetical protein